MHSRLFTTSLFAILIFVTFNSCDNPIDSLNLDKENILHNMGKIDVSDITAGRAIVSANPDLSNYDYVDFGFVYSTNKNPTLDDLRANIVPSNYWTSTDRTRPSGYVGMMMSLRGSTKYYVRPYVGLYGDPKYGEQVSFNTPEKTTPTMGIVEIRSVRHNSSNIEMMMDDNGGNSVKEFGVVYGTTPNPVKSVNNFDSYESQFQYYPYSFYLSGLQSETTYYVRAFLESESEIFYSEVDSIFTTLDGSPTIRTNSPSSLSVSSIRVNASILNYGETALTRVGFEYATTLPSSTSMIVDVPISSLLNGNFSTNIENLNRNTQYQMRAFVENSKGRGYGEIVEAYTKSGMATVVVDGVMDTTSTTATIQGTVYDDGGSSLLETGLVWSESSNPTISDNKMDTPGIDTFIELTITGLEPESRYFVRAFARNEFGYHYSGDFEITTSRP